MATSPSYYQQSDNGSAVLQPNVTDDVRTHFRTREGVYRLMKLSEYSRPTCLPPNGPNTTQFRIAFVSAPDTYNRRVDDLLAFIIGKELYVYYYNGIRKAADLTRPIEKKNYRGPAPTCHSFNQFTAKSDRLMLIIGFALGQIQLVEPMLKEYNKLFNEERMIDSTKVTCIQWVPGSPNHFLAAHASGQMYVYDERLPCGPTPPSYQLFKHGPGFSVHTCRAKSTRNPLYRWLVEGSGVVYAISFSPCTHYFAMVSADGQMRVFNYDEMELVDSMKSYFGGLRCVAWSPDGRYVATGGEDDLITIWSFIERRVLCRGSGHRSWVSDVAFDRFTCTLPDNDTCCVADIRVTDSAERQSSENHVEQQRQQSSSPLLSEKTVVSYRLGSVGDDAHVCFWEITEDVLFPRSGSGKQRTSVVNSGGVGTEVIPDRLESLPSAAAASAAANAARIALLTSSSESSGLSQKFTSLSIVDQHRVKESGGKRPFGTLAARTSDTRLIFTRSSKASCANGTASSGGDTVPPAPALGSPGCPCLRDIPLLEPLICKKVATERLTAIVFREDCFVVACQEGFVSTWARPSTLMRNGYM